LLLLHGLADHALVWQSLGQYLASHYHIVAPDLRGHGESSKPSSGYTSQAIIADLEALMANLGWENAHILGHSWSAKVTAIWATQSPERFRSLILVDPFFIGKIPPVFKLTFPLLYRVLPFLQTMKAYSSYEAAEHNARRLKQYCGWSPLQQQVFRASVEQKNDGRWGSKFGVAARDGIFADVMDVAALTQPVKIPTLFIQPEQGLNRTAWQLQPYRTYLKQLQITKVPGNHWAFLIQPQAFNTAVGQFLEEQRLG
jgi:pimeloyl-ACP methyl ester carboxylesterase